MKFQVCVMLDKKARAYAQPFFVTHTDLAVRTFKQAANTPGHQVNAHAEDFSLFYLGTYDDETAYFNLTATPTPLVEALQLKQTLLTPVTPVVDPNLGEE